MADASTVPWMGTRTLTRDATLSASMPVGSGEEPDPATSQPKRGQSLPNATGARRRGTGCAAATSAADVADTTTATKATRTTARMHGLPCRGRRSETGIASRIKVDGVTHPVQMGIEHGPAEQYPYVVSAFSRRARHGRPGMFRQATRAIALRAPPSPQEGVMNAAHLHLLLNPVPVIGAIGILLLALVAWIRPSPDVLRTTLLFAAGNAAAALVVYLTADGAEDLVR